MLQDLLSNQQRVEKLLSNDSGRVDWQKELDWFTLQLSQLQIERQLHLQVTLTVGLATLLSGLVSVIKPIFALLILDLSLGGLFVAYLFHYRKLENTAQHWYLLLTGIRK